MKLFLSKKSLFKYKKKIISMFSNEANFSIVCQLNHPLNLYRVKRYCHRVLKVVPSYEINLRKVSKNIISLLNKNKIQIKFIVTKKISKHDEKVISKIKDICEINDISNFNNVEVYKKHKNVIYSSQFGENTNKAALFDLGYFNETDYVCDFSSCLGNVLYLDEKGKEKTAERFPRFQRFCI